MDIIVKDVQDLIELKNINSLIINKIKQDINFVRVPGYIYTHERRCVMCECMVADDYSIKRHYVNDHLENMKKNILEITENEKIKKFDRIFKENLTEIQKLINEVK